MASSAWVTARSRSDSSLPLGVTTNTGNEPPIVSVFIISRVEDFLHYQRLREIFYVLETAFTAFRDSPHLLNPPFDGFNPRFKKSDCKDPSCGQELEVAGPAEAARAV